MVDVSVGAVEVLRSALEPGDRVVVNSPVYPPFFMWPGDAALDLVDVPLRPDDDGNGWRLDLPAIEAAFAAGARAHLLCHPHNPLGHLHPREDLVALADLADRYGVLVVADEIHAPLALPGNQFVPFLSVSDVAARVGVALHSASKAWNLAGLKFAFIITVHEEAAERLRKLPLELAWLTGHLGAMATATAYSQGEAWLDELLPVLADNQRRFAELLGEHLPEAVYRRGKAGYLAWVDTRALGWGDEPAATTLRHGRLALGIGSHFGDTGKGHVRVNLGCSPELVPEAVRRLVRTAELMSQERKS